MKNYLTSFIILLLLIPCFAVYAQQQSVSEKLVTIESGLISGIIDRDVKVFKGIPFAAPPVGNNRWRAPQPVVNWNGVKRCDKFGPNALQAAPVAFGVYRAEYLIPADGAMSEDCLYLNVWTTAKHTDERRPVIVFIHGGAFTGGSGSVPIYDGVAMAKKDIVFITINYRLGLFGFLAHPELTKEAPDHASSGNYGIMDQIAALQWVQRNIQQFGGDPRNVTIAGQSAGSASVNVLDATPLAKGLFQKIIAESGSRVVKGSGNVGTLADGEQKGLQFSNAVHAASLQELRTMDAEKLMAAYKGQGGLIVDGYILKEPVYETFAKGAQTIVPLLTGFNEDEGTNAAKTTVASYREMVAKLYGADSDRVMQLYPANSDEAAKRSLLNLTRDRQYGVQNYAWAKEQRKKTPVYMYYFKRKVPENAVASVYSSFHTAEVPYAYGNLQFVKRPFTKADEQLSSFMLSYWSNFAKTGDPNTSGLPKWPQFSDKEGKVMILDSAVNSTTHPFKEGLEFIYNKSTAQ